MWHWDGNPDDHRAGLRGVFVFMLFSTIQAHGGGTFLVAGSHRLINQHYAALPGDVSRKQANVRKMLLKRYTWLDDLVNGDVHAAGREEMFKRGVALEDDISLQVVEIVGAPGDVYFCHPSLFHSASFNGSDRPRFMRAKGLAQRAERELIG